MLLSGISRTMTTMMMIRLFTLTSHTSYAVRGIQRTEQAPDNRKADNCYRDLQMSLVTNGLTEYGLRLVQTRYVAPTMLKALELNELSTLYPNAKNYHVLPDIIRNRLTSTLVRSDSSEKVPILLKEMKNGAKNLSAEERAQLDILFDHLHKNLNFKDFLASKTLPAEQSNFVSEQVARLVALHGGQQDDFMNAVKEAVQAKTDDDYKQGLEKVSKMLADWKANFGKLASPQEQESLAALKLQERVEGLRSKSKLTRMRAVRRLKFDLNKYFKTIAEKQEAHHAQLLKGMDWEKALPGAKLENDAKKALTALIHDGSKADIVVKALKHIQKNGTWPQILCSVVFTFVFFGMSGSLLDLKVIQPWQEKLVKKRGTSQDYVWPAFLGLAPFLGVLGLGMQNKLQLKRIMNMGYLSRFVTMYTASMLAYLGTFFGLLKYSMSRPEPLSLSLHKKKTQPAPADSPVGQFSGKGIAAPAFSQAVRPSFPTTSSSWMPTLPSATQLPASNPTEPSPFAAATQQSSRFLQNV